MIVTSSYSSIENAVLSIHHGAVDYLTKPLRAEALRIAGNNAIDLDRMANPAADKVAALIEIDRNIAPGLSNAPGTAAAR